MSFSSWAFLSFFLARNWSLNILLTNQRSVLCYTDQSEVSIVLPGPIRCQYCVTWTNQRRVSPVGQPVVLDAVLQLAELAQPRRRVGLLVLVLPLVLQLEHRVICQLPTHAKTSAHKFSLSQAIYHPLKPKLCPQILYEETVILTTFNAEKVNFARNCANNF